jgi:lipopolysaccharide transport system ATP-binding protein
MSMRLAFAVAAHLEPDTLIIDEILAVGDTAFQKKCLGKMDEVARRGRSVLFVSHNLGAVRTLCSRALVLDRGTVRFDGSASEAIAYYLAHSAAAASEEGGEIRFGPSGQEFGNLTLHAVRVVDGRGEVRTLFDAADPIRVEIEYEVLATLRGARTVLRVSTQEGDVAFQSTDHEARDVEQRPGRYTTRCLIPGALLNRRMYVVEIAFELPFGGVLAPCRPYVSFVVSGGGNHGSTFPEPWPGAVCPSLRWTTERA